MELKKLIFVVVMLFIYSCATVRTVESRKNVCPDVYSGTVFNIETLLGSRASAKKYGVRPPRYPLADLPASFLLDTLLLPATISCSTGFYITAL